jgi:hypothetical protein
MALGHAAGPHHRTDGDGPRIEHTDGRLDSAHTTRSSRRQQLAPPMTGGLSLAALGGLTHGGIGTHDVPCPLCGPDRRALANRRRPVLRVWRTDPGYATYHCVRCGAHGWVTDGSAPVPDSVARACAEMAARDAATAAQRLRLAGHLWRMARPATGTVVETYLRSRGISISPPATVRFLPPRGEHPPTMIVAFGIASEPEPGVVAIADDQVRGVHLTHLLPDGSDRERGEGVKIMIGRSGGYPIVLAPPSNLLGLAVTEGIEDALSAHEATGLGAWAAGSASRLPTLAAVIPDYIECVTIYAHADDNGQRGAHKLARALNARGTETIIEEPV